MLIGQGRPVTIHADANGHRANGLPYRSLVAARFASLWLLKCTRWPSVPLSPMGTPVDEQGRAVDSKRACAKLPIGPSWPFLPSLLRLRGR